MERRVEINFSLILILSACIHLLLLIAVLAPQYTPSAVRSSLKDLAAARGGGMRDVIVNINADDKLVENESTLLSDKDSSARGHVSKDIGDTWLNNSREFSLPKSGSKGRSGSASGSGSSRGTGSGAGSGSGTGAAVKQFAASSGDLDDYPMALTLLHDPSVSGSSSAPASMEESEWTKIPDKKGINMKNALFLSSDGAFSFNTKKFADFEYFRQMKNKIGSNWAPPTFASGVMPEGANSRTGYGTPGYTAFRMIPSQEVLIYFTMNRAGDVTEVVIVDSMGNDSLDDSCVKSIRNSRNFGKVPDDIKGSRVVIPFIFGYYVY